MGVVSIDLPTDLGDFVSAEMERGLYSSPAEVVRAGLRALQREAEDDLSKLEELRHAIDAGDASEIAPDGVFDRVLGNISSCPCSP